MTSFELSIFKDYDIRGTYPDQLNAEVVTAIAHAIVRKFHPASVAVCRDMRVSGSELRDALMTALATVGVNVFDAGLTGTEIAYFIAGTKPYDMVIMLSASHNPPQYNGLKIMQKGPVSINSDNGLFDVRDLIAQGPMPAVAARGTVTPIDIWPEWKQKVFSLVDRAAFKPLRVVADAGNGMAGKLIPMIFDGLPFQLTPLYFELDGTFPHHTPNPLIEENNKDLVAKMKEVAADVGLAFDGDADRVFFIDDTGRFVSGTVITALLARYFLKKNPGAFILYSAVCGRVVPETVSHAGGQSKRVRVGHSYMKNYMREYNAIFGGEHSGHYYHHDYFFSETGVGTALMVLELISVDGRKFSEIVNEFEKYPASGEINFTVPDTQSIMDKLQASHTDAASVDTLDGLSVWYAGWWFNVRASHTEPLLRLNVEANTKAVLDTQTQSLVTAIVSMGGKRKE